MESSSEQSGLNRLVDMDSKAPEDTAFDNYELSYRQGARELG